MEPTVEQLQRTLAEHVNARQGIYPELRELIIFAQIRDLLAAVLAKMEETK